MLVGLLSAGDTGGGYCWFFRGIILEAVLICWVLVSARTLGWILFCLKERSIGSHVLLREDSSKTLKELVTGPWAQGLEAPSRYELCRPSYKGPLSGGCLTQQSPAQRTDGLC